MIPQELVPWLAVTALAVAALSLLIALFAALRTRRARRTGEIVVPGGGADLNAEIARLDRLGEDLAALAKRVAAAEEQSQRSLKRVGVVRFNPFPDTGSNQSFALAVLDARGDGYVLSSLHSRQATRLFLKVVSGGRTETPLSEEESEAIHIASSK